MGAIHRDLIGWTDIGSDVNWEDYGGKWARKGPAGDWYVVLFENNHDRWGDDTCIEEGIAEYLCEVRYCDFPETDTESRVGALQYVGLDEYIVRFDLDNSWRYQGLKVSPAVPEVQLVEAVISYGVWGVLTSFSSNTAPVGLRKKALRYAREMMRDDDQRDAALDQRANGFGNTVRDFARGKIG